MGKVSPFYDGLVIEGAEDDFRGAAAVDIFHVGREAFYFPAFFRRKYIPIAAMTAVEARTKLYTSHTCSGGWPQKLPVLVITTEKGKEIFQFKTMEDAERAAALIRERKSF